MTDITERKTEARLFATIKKADGTIVDLGELPAKTTVKQNLFQKLRKKKAELDK